MVVNNTNNKPIIINKISEIRNIISAISINQKKIGFVATMGYLHQGHLSLVERSIEENDITVVSIFVNPTQFGENEDFDSYPSNLDGDIKLLSGKASYIFCPNMNEIYDSEHATTVVVNKYTSGLCGDSRKGHFSGVATIVSKLFNIITPDNAYFGEKDRQQLLIIKQLVKDLNYPISIIGCPTIREIDGLAMSSRNVKLNIEERKQAGIINVALKQTIQAFQQGIVNCEQLIEIAKNIIAKKSLANIDYIEIRNISTWQVDNNLNIAEEYVLAVAVKFGSTRLIDNMQFGSEVKG